VLANSLLPITYKKETGQGLMILSHWFLYLPRVVRKSRNLCWIGLQEPPPNTNQQTPKQMEKHHMAIFLICFQKGSLIGLGPSSNLYLIAICFETPIWWRSQTGKFIKWESVIWWMLTHATQLKWVARLILRIQHLGIISDGTDMLHGSVFKAFLPQRDLWEGKN
jgi:hypothetical protein